MAKVMMNIQSDQPPTLGELKERLGLREEEIDRNFGVVLIDPDDHLYTIRVEHDAAAKVLNNVAHTTGPYQDPKIEPFGPVR